MPQPRIDINPALLALAEVPGLLSFKRGLRANIMSMVQTAHDKLPARLNACLAVLSRAARGNVHASTVYRNCFGEITMIRLQRVLERFDLIASHLAANVITYRVGFEQSPDSVASVNHPQFFFQGFSEWKNVMALEVPFFEQPPDGGSRSQISVIIHELTHAVKSQRVFVGTGDKADVTITLGSLASIIIRNADIDIGSVNLLAASSPDQALMTADCYELFSALSEAALAADALMPLPDGAPPPPGGGDFIGGKGR